MVQVGLVDDKENNVLGVAARLHVLQLMVMQQVKLATEGVATSKIGETVVRDSHGIQVHLLFESHSIGPPAPSHNVRNSLTSITNRN